MKAKQNIVVTVDKDQKYYIGTSLVPSEQLDTLLKQAIVNARQTIDSPSVVINADTVALYGEVFRIMRLAKRNGAKVAALVK